MTIRYRTGLAIAVISITGNQIAIHHWAKVLFSFGAIFGGIYMVIDLINEMDSTNA